MILPAQAKTRRRLALLCFVPLAFSLLFYLVNQRGDSANVQIRSIQNLQVAVITLQSLAEDCETGERGFLLTGDERYLTPYQQARSRLPTEIDYTRLLIKDMRQFQVRTERVIAADNQVFGEAKGILDTWQKQGFAIAFDRFKGKGQSFTGQDSMDQLRKSVGELDVDLDRSLSQALERQHTYSRGAFIFFIVGAIVMMSVLWWLYNALLSYIHDRETAQAELEVLNTELEERIAARTRELSQSNEELQQFAYVASHDLQEPLRTITSFTQLLANRYQGRLDADADEFITYIVTSSRRMTDLINGLLALVRLRKLALPRGPVAIEKLLNDATSSLQASIRESGARVEHTSLPFLAADPVQITQLFQNLIGNAIKYRRAADPIIKVSARRDAAEWVFAIEDNGQGFDQQYAERIFGLFQRLHGRDVEGTGMGLSISRKIVERHGGRMWAESRLGEGSTFFFSLPISLEPGRFPTPSTSSKRGVSSSREVPVTGRRPA
jgi:signal transduction histidine kinase